MLLLPLRSLVFGDSKPERFCAWTAKGGAFCLPRALPLALAHGVARHFRVRTGGARVDERRVECPLPPAPALAALHPRMVSDGQGYPWSAACGSA